jgi:hypothetical protein
LRRNKEKNLEYRPETFWHLAGRIAHNKNPGDKIPGLRGGSLPADVVIDFSVLLSTIHLFIKIPFPKIVAPTKGIRSFAFPFYFFYF